MIFSNWGCIKVKTDKFMETKMAGPLREGHELCTWRSTSSNSHASVSALAKETCILNKLVVLLSIRYL